MPVALQQVRSIPQVLHFIELWMFPLFVHVAHPLIWCHVIGANQQMLCMPSLFKSTWSAIFTTLQTVLARCTVVHKTVNLIRKFQSERKEILAVALDCACIITHTGVCLLQYHLDHPCTIRTPLWMLHSQAKNPKRAAHQGSFQSSKKGASIPQRAGLRGSHLG